MKSALVISATFLIFSSLPPERAEAISRYNSMSMTCGQVKQVIQNEGAVIIRFPSRRNTSLTLHNRFVKNASRCQLDEYAARRSIPTADTEKCRLRYCKAKEVSAGKRRIGGSGGSLGTTFLEN